MAFMRSVGVRLRMFVDQYKQDAAEARKANEQLAGSGKKAKVDLDQMAGTLTIVGGLLTAAAAATVVATARFDKQMSEVGAVANATGEDLDRLREAAIAAGQATSFSASEAAMAEAELAKAGVITADILGGALSGALSLAAAGSLELATAAEISAKTMNAFGLEGADVGHIADVLAAAANKSATSVEELGVGLQQVGLVANQVGFSMEETVALLAAFADRGLAGSDGATSLKTALLRLAAPLGEAQELMKQLGISLYDSNGNMVDAITIAGQLQRGMSDLSDAERNAALNTIFGADAIRAANVLYDLGADGVREYLLAVDDQGAAADVAAAKLDNLAGDVEALGGSLETLFIKSNEGTTGPLRGLVQRATDIANAFGALPSSAQGAVVGIAGVTGVALLGVAAMLKMRSGLANVVEGLTAMGPAGAKAGKGLQGVAGWAGRVGGVLAGVTIATQLFGAAVGEGLNPQLDATAEGLQRWVETGKVSGEFARLLGDDLSKLDEAFGQVQDPIHGAVKALEGFLNLGGIDDSHTKSAERIAALDAALAQMVNSGNIEGAAAGFALLRDRAIAQGMSMDEVKEAFPAYAAALEVVQSRVEEVDPAIEAAAQHNIALAGAFGAAANEADGLRLAFDKLNGAMLTWRGAERDAEAAVDELEAALEESNGSLDIHDEKGRAAAAAVDSLAQAAIDAAQAKYDETGSVEAANAVYEDYVGQLRQVLINAGYSEQAVNDLINEIAAVPTYKAITFDVFTNNIATGSFGYGHGGQVMAQGGILHAAAGRMESTVVSSPTVLFGERQTEMEAFIPKRGNVSRSMGILSEAAGWYNADVVPRGTWASGGGSAVDVRVSLAPGADTPLMRAIEDRLRVEVVQAGGGSVQSRYGQRGRQV